MTSFQKPPYKCPVCLREGGTFLFIRDYLNKENRYSLFGCGLCENQFWMPFIGPGHNWYENNERQLNRIEVDKDFSRGFKWNVKQFFNDPVHKETFGKKLLDLGCGTGRFILDAKRSGYNVYGVDFDANQIATAKKFGLENVFCGDLFDFLKDKKEEYDVITSFEVVEHLEYPKLFLDIIYKSLKPGGFLCLSTPNRLSYVKKDAASDFPPNHLIRWSKKSLRNLVLTVGFEEVDVKEEVPTDLVVSKFRFGLVKKVRKILKTKTNKKTDDDMGFKKDKLVVLGSIKDNLIRPVAYLIARCLFLFKIKGQFLYLEARKKA